MKEMKEELERYSICEREESAGEGENRDQWEAENKEEETLDSGLTCQAHQPSGILQGSASS